MKVLYDVTNLGLGFGTELTRTGIFRATEHLVRAVLASGAVEARFAAIESYASEVQLARFDRSVAGLLGGRIIPAWTSGDGLASSIDLVDRLLAADALSAEGKRLSAELKLLNRAARPRPIAERFDVYHSLRQPLPAPDRVGARARAVSIPDMIPDLFPELTEERFVQQHRAIVGSIDMSRDWVVCRSACTKADICATTGMAAERVFVTPFAAARDIFHPERDGERVAAVCDRHGIGPRPYLLSLCTLEPRKNLPRLVRAFFALAADRRWRDLRLVLVGPTGWKAEALFAEPRGAAGPPRAGDPHRLRARRGSERALHRRPRVRIPVALRGVRIAGARGHAVRGARDRVSQTSSLPEVVGERRPHRGSDRTRKRSPRRWRRSWRTSERAADLGRRGARAGQGIHVGAHRRSRPPAPIATCWPRPEAARSSERHRARGRWRAPR